MASIQHQINKTIIGLETSPIMGYNTLAHYQLDYLGERGPNSYKALPYIMYLWSDFDICLMKIMKKIIRN